MDICTRKDIDNIKSSYNIHVNDVNGKLFENEPFLDENVFENFVYTEAFSNVECPEIVISYVETADINLDVNVPKKTNNISEIKKQIFELSVSIGACSQHTENEESLKIAVKLLKEAQAVLRTNITASENEESVGDEHNTTTDLENYQQMVLMDIHDVHDYCMKS